MNNASIVLATLLILVCVGSAMMDFRQPEHLVESMKKLSIPASRLPLFGIIKILGAAGLAIGFQRTQLGVLAGAGLSIYFAIATLAHTRIKDTAKDTAPAFVLFVISVLYVLTTVAS